MTTKATTQRLTESAIMIALATVLSILKIIHLPLGGSITLMSMLPIVMIAIKYGTRWGLCISGLYAAVQIALDIGGILAWGLTPEIFIGCLVFDYIIAFGGLGLGGLWRKKGLTGQIVGISVALAIRFIAHFISGIIFFGQWDNGVFGAIRHSILYNGSFMLPELIFTIIGAAILLKAPYIKKLCQPI